MKDEFDSIVNIDGVLYPIHKKNGKYAMQYAGIELHPTDDVDTLLAAFSGHSVKRYKSTNEFNAWYNETIKLFPT